MMDDRIVELVKLALLDGIAGRAEAGVAGLMLVEVSDTERYLAFQPIGADNQPIGQQQLRAPLEMYDDIERSRDNLIQLFPALFQGLWIHHSVASKRFAS